MKNFETNKSEMSLPQFAIIKHNIEDFADIRTQNLNRLSECIANINAKYKFNLNVKNLRAFLTG